MALNKELFGPRDESEEDIFAVENFIFDVQMSLAEKMKEQNITRSDLADRLNLSRARISQLFSNNTGNMTLATLARITQALNLLVSISFKPNGAEKQQEMKSDRVDKGAVHYCEVVQIWRDKSANQNHFPYEIAA